MAASCERRPEPGAGDQAEVIAFLGDPLAYDPPLDAVDRIDTHGAIVFLAGDHAYKIKRALALAYLDFSTLEKRRAVCEHELERNAAAAPGIYLGVVPIVRRSDGGLALDGTGEAVEWAVKMRRFDQAALLDRMAVEGRLDLALMVPLADRIAAYHGEAPAVCHVDGHQIVSRVATQTVTAFKRAGDLLDPGEVCAFADAVSEALEANSPLLRLRAGTGFVRLCHGDLHLQNIVLQEGRPTLFDAIEFDDEIATIDVLYDVAFLVMDLWNRDLRRHANLVLNRYLVDAGADDNLAGLAALPLFLAVRAAVRAMVAIDRLTYVAEGDRRPATAELTRYFALASAFLQPARPRLIAFGGRSGTGKSTLAAALAPDVGLAPGAVHLRSDIERKRLFGAPETERLPAEAYTKAVTERVYRRICDKAGMALAAGHSVVLDAVFLAPGERGLAEAAASRAGAAFAGIWLDAPRDRLVARVRERRDDASDADAAVVALQYETDTGPMSWRTVGAGGDRDAVRATVADILGLGKGSG